MKLKNKRKPKTVALSIISLLVVAFVILVTYLGAFTHISVQEQAEGPFILLYQESSSSSMKEVGMITSQLDKLLTKQGLSQRQPLDVFYPDGHAEIGFAVNSISVEQLSTISLQAKLKQIPVQKCMVVNFPWRNKLSFVVGYFKVNAALNSYRKSHGYQKTEAYVLNKGNTIVYMQPVVKP